MAYCCPGTGAGRWSLDHAMGFFDPPGRTAAGLAAAGIVGGLGLLAVFWRRARLPQPDQTVLVVPGGTELPSLLLDELVDRLRRS